MSWTKEWPFWKPNPKPDPKWKDEEIFTTAIGDLLKKYSATEIIHKLSKEDDVDWSKSFFSPLSLLMWLERLEKEKQNDVEKH